MVNQILHRRRLVGRKEKLKVKRDRADRESRLWIQGLAAVGPTPANCHWVHVADRSADTFEFLARNAAHGTEFVVRSRTSA